VARPVKLLDGRAVTIGAGVTVLVAVPLAIAGRIAAGEGSGLVALFFVGVLGAFVVGGYVAARVAGSAPYSNSAVAAALGWLVLQAVSLFLMLRRGETVNPVVIVANGLAAYSCGLIGGLVASRLPARGAEPS
jgi:hypothetical protein